nr:tail fiber domain-containing protein [Escherichia coli]
MSAGTITLTNNSAAVSGAGTAFTTDLKAGDFIVSVVGGVTYTLPVKTVNSATGVTLLKNYDGPTQAGAAWSAVPRDTMNAITAQLAAETAQALRGLNYDKQNWQQVFSGGVSITTKLPDGSEFTGPSWKYLSDNMVTNDDLRLNTVNN